MTSKYAPLSLGRTKVTVRGTGITKGAEGAAMVSPSNCDLASVRAQCVHARCRTPAPLHTTTHVLAFLCAL